MVRITQSDDNANSITVNHSSANPLNKENTTSSYTSQNQSNVLVPYSSVGLIVDTSGAPVSFINSPMRQEGVSSTCVTSGLHHENWSGSARTDFMYRPGGKKGRNTSKA